MSHISAQIETNCPHCNKQISLTVKNATVTHIPKIDPMDSKIISPDPLDYFLTWNQGQNKNVIESMQKSPFPIQVTVKHNGFWVTDDQGVHQAINDIACAKNSVILDPGSMLYVYKLAFRHLLLSMGIICPRDIDSQNLVPHIAIRKNKNGSLTNYSTIQGRKFTINPGDVTVRNDFILLELDRAQDLHMTLIYKKGIGKQIDLMACFRLIIHILALYPELMQSYANLSYFGNGTTQSGKSHANYWYETPDSFPFKITGS